ncbi:MAG TPA: glycoside hydrolase family 15 protein [Pirellulales bacterium]|jgi:GH15 family glucan-1,4-alpha-glucosidase|nr:glycoside hydrolase family 15 protein [Pirellulales bacterium]
MSAPIEDYAMIGDLHTAALVSRDASIDWLCLPRFDSPACFAALLGTEEHGRWQLCPPGKAQIRRRYLPGTLVLETEFETDQGAVAVIDCMLPRREHPALVRMVKGRRGNVPMRMDMSLRFEYGSIVPWVKHEGNGFRAIAGPDRVVLASDVEIRGEGFSSVADFEISEGQSAAFVLTWHASHDPAPEEVDAPRALEDTERWWRDWSDRCRCHGVWCDAVKSSLIVLKALIYAPTGGMVAAATTSLPEQIGGIRNWDYRYCWLRDATFTLYALIAGGYVDEAAAWREWLLRAVAGRASQMNIMYGVAGERRLTEIELEWLPGYENSRPVRIGNAAHQQFQLDVFGEVMDALHLARRYGLAVEQDAWDLQLHLIDHLEDVWNAPDEGIWEIRGPRQHFTHSRVMAWVAVDRMIRSAEQFHCPGPIDRWRRLREAIHDQVCQEGFNAERNSFVQHYGSKELDASLLMIPLVGFLPASDPRVRGTLDAIQRELLIDGFVQRYNTRSQMDGLPPGEGVFLPCTFWLADNLNLVGRREEAVELFERLLLLRNDVGLLAEEYAPRLGRQVGNFPQAFSHVSLVNTAINLSTEEGPASHRQKA